MDACAHRGWQGNPVAGPGCLGLPGLTAWDCFIRPSRTGPSQATKYCMISRIAHEFVTFGSGWGFLLGRLVRLFAFKFSNRFNDESDM